MLASFTLATLSLYAAALLPIAQAQDQDVITLFAYGDPTATGPSDVNDAIQAGKNIIGVEPIAVDTEGYTFYKVVQENSVAPSLVRGVVTDVVLPTPTTYTFTFRADASRFHQAVATKTSISGIKADVDFTQDCTHDVDSDTSAQEGKVVCVEKAVIKAEGNGQKLTTTLVTTATGKPSAIWTLTNAANLNLPTGEPGSAGNVRGNLGLVGIVCAALFSAAQLVL